MPVEMLPADWVLAAATLAMAVLGLFRGFSGTLAFIAASASAAAAALFGWNALKPYIGVEWQRGAAILLAALLVFGLVRIIVKKIVNGLLAQPTDSILGFILGAASGVFILVGWAFSGYYLEYSNLALEVARHVR